VDRIRNALQPTNFSQACFVRPCLRLAAAARGRERGVAAPVLVVELGPLVAAVEQHRRGEHLAAVRVAQRLVAEAWSGR
jgi:hypothetical protein